MSTKKKSSPSNRLRQLFFHRRKIKTQNQSRMSLVKKFLLGFFICASVGGLSLLIFIASVIQDAPNVPEEIRNVESTLILDREGNPLYTIHGEENRQEIPINEIPQTVIDATIAIEDDEFFDHYGFDFGGIVKAVFYEFFGVGVRRGGSTITQQLVKNTLLTPERTIMRKVRELILSIQLERKHTKPEILHMYLNTIPYGSNAYGIEVAARTYFGKKARNLSLLEAAILASLPQAPSRFNPYGNGRDALMGYYTEDGTYIKGRKDLVLDRMLLLGRITEEQHTTALKEAQNIKFQRLRENIKHPHFVLYVKELLEEKFGKELLETGGLQVYTTLDPQLQEAAESIIAEKSESYTEIYQANNAALLSVDNRKGHILAMVGSADYFNEEIDGNVNVVFRPRLPGSSFKPLVFATGFSQGYSPATVLYDLETDFGNNYIPQNYDGTFEGPMSIRKALAGSRNVPAVKMAALAGVDKVVQQAKRMGISDLQTPDFYGTSIGLGTGEATLYQMVTAYSVFANNGKKIAYTPFLRIITKNGVILEDNSNNEFKDLKSVEVLDPQVAFSINDILSDKFARPAGWSALEIAGYNSAAKTGTSNTRLKEGNTPGSIKPRDNWTIGYTPSLVTGVWVGNNDSSPLSFKASGLTTAAPIWKSFMTQAVSDRDDEPFKSAEGIQWKRVSRYSGLLPSQHTRKEDIISEVFTSFNIPTEEDSTFLTLEVDRVSKKLPSNLTPDAAISEVLVANFQSQRPQDPNWEEPVQEWAEQFIDTFESDMNVLKTVPSEEDDIHTAETALKAPTLTIESPSDKSNVPPGLIDVVVDIQAPHGVEKVEYFLNQGLADTVTEYPYHGKIRIRRPKTGETYRIGVTVTDQLFYQTTQVIHVTTAETEDIIPPEVTLVYPGEGALFQPDTSVAIKADARDNLAIEKVEFYFDDILIGEDKKAPYQLTYTIPDEISLHDVRAIAVDTSGNKGADAIRIRVEEINGQSNKTQFSFPNPQQNFQVGKNIDFFFTLSYAEQRSAENIEVILRDSETGIERNLLNITPDNKKASQNYSFTWRADKEGNYTTVIKTKSKTGRIRLSEELPIQIIE